MNNALAAGLTLESEVRGEVWTRAHSTMQPLAVQRAQHDFYASQRETISSTGMREVGALSFFQKAAQENAARDAEKKAAKERRRARSKNPKPKG